MIEFALCKRYHTEYLSLFLWRMTNLLYASFCCANYLFTWKCGCKIRVSPGKIASWFPNLKNILTDKLLTCHQHHKIWTRFSLFRISIESGTKFRMVYFNVQCDFKRNEIDVRRLDLEQQHQTHHADFSSRRGVFWLHLLAWCLLVLLLPYSTRKWISLYIT